MSFPGTAWMASRSSTASFNVVAGNKIGTDVSGTVALGNSYNGVEVDAGCIGTTIGGTASAAGNVISANGNDGVESGTPTRPPSRATRSVPTSPGLARWERTVGV